MAFKIANSNPLIVAMTDSTSSIQERTPAEKDAYREGYAAAVRAVDECGFSVAESISKMLQDGSARKLPGPSTRLNDGQTIETR